MEGVARSSRPDHAAGTSRLSDRESRHEDEPAAHEPRSDASGRAELG